MALRRRVDPREGLRRRARQNQARFLRRRAPPLRPERNCREPRHRPRSLPRRQGRRRNPEDRPSSSRGASVRKRRFHRLGGAGRRRRSRRQFLRPRRFPDRRTPPTRSPEPPPQCVGLSSRATPNGPFPPPLGKQHRGQSKRRWEQGRALALRGVRTLGSARGCSKSGRMEQPCSGALEKLRAHQAIAHVRGNSALGEHATPMSDPAGHLMRLRSTNSRNTARAVRHRSC